MKSPKLLVAVGMVLLVSASAFAANVSGTCSTITSATELNQSISCTQFNSALGTLTSIQLTISGGINGSLTLTNNASTSQNVSGTTSSAFSIGSLTGFTFVNPFFSASYGTGVQTLTAGQTQTFSGLSGTGSAGPLTDSNNATFATYIGGGVFFIPVSTLTGVTISGGGGQVAFSQSTTANATATVVYNFNPPTQGPEPASMVLLGAGLLGLGSLCRKTRA